jgi:phage terminase large subunit-like protein
MSEIMRASYEQMRAHSDTIQTALVPEGEVNLKLQKLKVLEGKEKLRQGLPHLYGWKWYKWAREFYESTNAQNFLSAGNQLSKSSTQIRKCIEWAGNPALWPQLWRTKPLQFWYLYPTKDISTIEFKKKWVPEFMPAGEYKKHPTYGWEEEIDSRKIVAVHFKSGVSVYFKTYAQEASSLQAGTCHAIFCDEELPVDLFEELGFRLAATDGYFHMVFTATLGQEYWRRVLEMRGTKDEMLPEAAKWQISAYDCLTYDDGTRSPWSEEKIERMKHKCKSQAEILKRIYGRFVMDSGLKYPTYNREVNRGLATIPLIPEGWRLYSAVDVGSGGDSGHPAAIVFVAIDPMHTKGRVVRAWRGDGIVTTASDVLMKYIELRGNWRCERQFYDWASKDFYTIASRIGESFEPAEKSHELGEQVLNTLFKNGMLVLDDGDSEIDKLEFEILTLSTTTDKRKAKDDLVDALRYAVSKIPWAFEIVQGPLPTKPNPWADLVRPGERVGIDELRRLNLLPKDEDPLSMGSIEAEIAEYNEQYGT